jgi:hypothetical protein
VKRHASDERYRDFFHKNSVEDIGKLPRQCFAPALLNVFEQRREDDLAIKVYTCTQSTQLIA